MQHRNITTHEWSLMAIGSLFERGRLQDWREFTQALQNNEELARNTLLMCDRHPDERSSALARVLVEHFRNSASGQNSPYNPRP